jgi:hypothetical protein
MTKYMFHPGDDDLDSIREKRVNRLMAPAPFRADEVKNANDVSPGGKGTVGMIIIINFCE